ncbi:hypothetical protein [Rathayibacter sp. VKM Ac-2926]|uniref:hypothetical protein n=1 Tax=Rathayibacter sp. VKM Ac-2926 TaxID=2929477 RepID=UPI001FB43DF5|nr:hypothetical protein [Rathayibacter sp. VKM Ac-2926]MCJ1704380.1 hypothetical protein [Rathayibacter sp. VKM Ac-2926]
MRAGRVGVRRLRVGGPSERVHAVRALHRSRAAAEQRGGAYAGYLAAMTLLVVVLPVLRAVVLLAAEPAPALAALDPMTVVGLTAGLLLPAAVLLGRVRGPAVGEPHTSAVLLATDLPRHLVLRRPVAIAGTAAVLASAAAALLIAVAVGGAPLVAVGPGAAFGVLLAVAWLAGQCLPGRGAALLTGVLGAAAALPAGPDALLGRALTTADPSALPGTAVLTALAALALAVVPRLLDTVRGGVVVAQSRQWRSARSRGAIGEVADALEGYRARPGRFRRLDAVRVAPFALAVPLRDAIGALRTPGRSVAGVAALAAAGLALAVAAVAPPSLLALPAALAGVLAYCGAGVWSDGLRHAAATAGQPALLAPAPFELLLLHGILPLLLAVGIVVAACALAAGPAWPAVAVAVVAVAARAMDATRGPLPPSLLGPIPLPIGDGAGAAVLLWNLAGVLVTGAAAVGVASAPGLLAAVPVVAVGCLLIARRRLARA